MAAGRALSAAPKTVTGDVVDGATSAHVLILGDEEFALGSTLPLGTLIRYAGNDMLGIHHLLLKLVDEADHERMWDAFETLEAEDLMAAITEAIEGYSAVPLAGRSSSRGGRARTTRR